MGDGVGKTLRFGKDKWREISYGEGNQWFPLSAQRFNPEFLPGLKTNDLEVLGAFTFIAWKTKSWKAEVSVSVLEEGLRARGLASGAIKRSIKRLIKASYLKCIKTSHVPGVGNTYLICSALMLDSYRAHSLHYELAEALTVRAEEKRKQAIDRRSRARARAQKKWAAEAMEAIKAGKDVPDPEVYMASHVESGAPAEP